MSKYTTEVRFICETLAGLTESKGEQSIEDIISSSKNKIFDFNYPIFDETYRDILETKILKHFYTREIGEETIGLWKLRLNTRLNEIMPFYNKLYNSELLEFNPLYTANFTTTRDINGTNNRTENETIKDTNSGNGSVTRNGVNWNLYNDTPQGSVQNIENGTYLTNATKNTDNTTDTSNNSGRFDRDRGVNGTGNSTEHYLEHVVGYRGINPSKMLLDYRSTFLNIDVRIINELEDLFIQLW